MIKIIVTDVNGVLLPFTEHVPRSSVIEALKRIHEAGVAVVMCTSNPYLFIEEIVDRAGLMSPQIFNGGRHVYIPGSRDIHEMPPGSRKKDAAQWVLDTLRSYPHETLGVGDMPIDLGFMGLCNKVATLESAHLKVKKFVKEEKGFIAPTVEEDGFVKIIQHYFDNT